MEPGVRVGWNLESELSMVDRAIGLVLAHGVRDESGTKNDLGGWVSELSFMSMVEKAIVDALGSDGFRNQYSKGLVSELNVRDLEKRHKYILLKQASTAINKNSCGKEKTIITISIQ